MKHMKKLLSLVLTLVTVFALSATAMADETYTITAPSDGHTYVVYQIFTGDLSENKTILSNIKWGQNGKGTKDEAVDDNTLSALTALENSTSNTEKLDEILENVNLNSTPIATIEGETRTASVAPGYYLIKDKDGSVTGEDSAYTTYIVEIVDNVTITRKVGTPSLDKQVEEKNDSTGASSWGDTADHDIDEKINYKLIATLPTNYADYRAFKMVFTDTMDAGLTYNDDAKVYAVNEKTKTELAFTITPITNGFTATCNNIKTLEHASTITADTKIVVEYTAKLNGNAKIGAEGNKNTADLTYSNDPNWDGTGEPTTGNTPDDTNIVFTYKATVDKVKGDKKTALEGAGFTLYKGVNNDWIQIGKEITNVTTFAFSGLDEGKYKLKETTVPDGYNKAADVIFCIESELDNTNEALTTLVVKDEDGNVISGDDLTFTADKTSGTVATKVVNKPGTLLPETGGIGTTIFYVLGGVMMAGAVVLMVTKRRMNAER